LGGTKLGRTNPNSPKDESDYGLHVIGGGKAIRLVEYAKRMTELAGKVLTS
jgi:hypothetical protein